MAKTKRILHLTVKKKWFDLIASGEKTIEYRQGKAYWEKRLLDENGNSIEFAEVHFRNGYSRNAPFMRVEFKDLGRWEGSSPWPCCGAHGEVVNHGDFGINLGKILETRR